MFDFFQELSKAQEIEKNFLLNLEGRWNFLPEFQQEQITETVEQMKSRGAICSKYDFI